MSMRTFTLDLTTPFLRLWRVVIGFVPRRTLPACGVAAKGKLEARPTGRSSAAACLAIKLACSAAPVFVGAAEPVVTKAHLDRQAFGQWVDGELGSRTADGEPLVFMGAFVAEGGHGLQWLREDGTKIGGQHWVGGTWTGAPTLAVDLGDEAVADHLCYVGSIWEGERRLTAKTRALGDQPVFKEKLGDDPNRRSDDRNAPPPPPALEGFDGGDKIFVLGGIAARDGMLVCSLTRQNELLVIDVRAGQIAERIPVDNPRGMAFDHQRRLLVLSGSRLIRFARHWSDPQPLIASGLEDPRHVASMPKTVCS